MAIKSFNSADINNISKQDGRYNVIENISGAKRTLNPPAAAYSVRKLTGLTGVPYDGPAMRILVDATGDGPDATDLEFDINFTADGDLDVADIELKCTGGKDAYVVKWYDQSGAGNDAAQTTYANMPQICSAGSVITINGKTAIHTPNADQDLECSGTNALSQVYTVNAVGQGGHPYAYNGGASRIFMTSSNVRFKAGTEIQVSGINASGNQTTVFCVADGTNSTIHAKNSGAQVNTTGDAGTQGIGFDSFFQIGNRASFTNGGYTQELVFWGSDQSSNRPTIENNINSYFNIYQSRENILPGAAAAYSLRQLSDSSRLAVRVRRDTGIGSGTDDDEADVGFDANGEVSLDSPVSNFDPTGSAATTLGEFLADAAYDDKDSLGSPAEGFVTAWYDQSSNSNNATQSTPSKQPKIYNGTDVYQSNSKPAIYVDPTNANLAYSLVLGTAVTMDSIFMVVQKQAISGYPIVFYITGNSAGNADYGIGIGGSFVGDDAIYFDGVTSFPSLQSTTAVGTSQHLVSVHADATTDNLALDGTIEATGTVNPSTIANIFNRRVTNDSNRFEGYCQEMIIYDTDQSSNRTDIEGNINAHYGIENFGTPSSGLLADYPGSAAAYSVRKLADTAGLAMRIIVDDTAVIGTVDASDTEYDIGFDANGDLDVARIREVCNNPSGANYNAYVVTWYDQSGNGNHATQTTYTACPQIYDGVDVIMENGKPIITSSANAFLKTAYDGNAIFFSVAVPINGCVLGHYDLTSGGGSNSNGWLYLAEAAYGGNAFGPDITINSARKNGSAYSTTGAAADDIYTDFVGQNLLYTSLSTASQNLNFGYRPSPGVFPMWSMQEFIIYPDSSTHTPRAIETDIDSYYRIYGDPDDGLLSTPYGKGAAAAYSVRRLSNNATRAMRILVDADANGPDASDNEYDIGFDVNGELDIARIEELCDKGTGNYNAYVTTWYDQSGEGNDATQATHANMPKICNAGTVITKNGKPAVDFDGVDDTMAASYGSLYSIPCTYSLVHTWPAYPGTYAQMMDGTNSTYRHIYRLDPNGTTVTAQAYSSGSGSLTFTDNLTDGQQYLSYIDFSGSGGSFVAIDGTVVTSGVTATTSINGVTLGTTFNFAFDCAFSVQEFIMWPSDQDGAGNRNFIEANINDYFNIEGV